MLSHFLRTANKTLAPSGVTFIGSTLSVHNAGLKNIIVSVPAGAQIGDLLVLVGLRNNANSSWSAYAGWTERIDVNGRYTASRIWDGGSSTYTLDLGNDDGANLSMLCFRNATFGVISSMSNAATNPSAPAITTSVNSSLIVSAVSLVAGGTDYDTPSGFELRQAAFTPSTLKVVTKTTLVASGSQPTVPFTRLSTTATTGRAWQFSISPI